MSSPSPPESIDPQDILAFASTCTTAAPGEPTFQELFPTLFIASSTVPLPPYVRIYIVRQPVPAKHRRSYVEVKDLRNLCGRSDPNLTSENDLKDAVIVMKKVSCSDHQGRTQALPVPPSNISLCDTSTASSSCSSSNDERCLRDHHDHRGETSSGAGSGYSSLTEDNTDCLSGPVAVLASGAQRVPIEIFEPRVLSQTGLRTPDPFASSDDEEEEDEEMGDESEDEDGSKQHTRNSTNTSNDTIRPSRKLRRLRSNPGDLVSTKSGMRSTAEETEPSPYQCHTATLSPRFRPLVQDGEVQFEVWVVAFLMTPLSASRSRGSEISNQALIDPQQQSASTVLSPEQRPVLVNLPHTMPPAATAGNIAVITIMNQPSERQRQISIWIEQVAQFLGTHVLESFVRNEVAHSRIGIDFKKIIQEKKMRPQRRAIN